MKRITAAIGLLVTLTSVVCEDHRVAAVAKPRPIGVIYLIQFLNQPEIPNENGGMSNVIPSDNPYKNSKLLFALSPNNIQKEKGNGREKRSPGYKGGGGGGCSACGGGGGGGYPGGGGGGGGYPGGGGGGYGGGGASAGSWSQSSSSAGSFGSGGGGHGGKYGK